MLVSYFIPYRFKNFGGPIRLPIFLFFFSIEQRFRLGAEINPGADPIKLFFSFFPIFAIELEFLLHIKIK